MAHRGQWSEHEARSVIIRGVRAARGIEVSETRARWLGHRLGVRIIVSVSAELTVARAHVPAEAVEHALKEAIPVVSGASIHTHPGRYAEMPCHYADVAMSSINTSQRRPAGSNP
jgi:divalent metal cation (Fe/Co/Zn/Cd) transporter